MTSAKQYRTLKQFEEVRATLNNGNLTQAALDCIEYGLSVHDLKRFYVELGLDDDIWMYAELTQKIERTRG